MKSWIVLAVVVAAIVAIVYWRASVAEPADPFDHLMATLIERYDMEKLPEGAGSSAGNGITETAFLSKNNPAPTVEAVKATVIEACDGCSITQYTGGTYLVSHPNYSDQNGGQQSEARRFIVLSWEGPLGNKDDGGFAFVETRRTD